MGAPRLVGIEHPFGQIVGPPGETGRQHEVLLATLEALKEVDIRGSVRYLPFEWNGTQKEAMSGPKVAPPIATHLKRHPWELPRLFSRNVSTYETT